MKTIETMQLNEFINKQINGELNGGIELGEVYT